MRDIKANKYYIEHLQYLIKSENYIKEHFNVSQCKEATRFRHTFHSVWFK